MSMISPYMLEGIELTKSVMADQEATATGGIVNFKIKKAPDEPSFNVVAQGGMNDLRDTYQNYKLSLGGSHRFYENMLGLYAQVDYEEKDAGSQQLGGVTFFQENEQAPVRTNSMQLMDIFRHFQRLGGVMVLDYMLPSTEIKLSNFASRIQRQETRYVNNYGFFDQNFGINYADTPGSHLTVLINSLTVDHQWKNWEFKTAFSHSYSENILPDRITSENSNSPQSPFPADRKANYNVNLDPETIPYLLTVSMDEAVNFMDLGGIAHEESETRERDLTGAVNLAYSLNLSDQVNMKISFGGKYRHKTKQYDRTDWEEGTSQIFRNMIIDDFKDELCQRTLNAWDADNMRILLIDFFDEDYKGGDFLDGKYNFGNIFDKQKFRRIHELVKAEWDPSRNGFLRYSSTEFHYFQLPGLSWT
ncbi:MAG: hypothetical protein U5R06_21240 [candidate division KSB1 bacterium]|nr:hypothetical protein [candidate division KSB1 bacterium]